MKLFAITHAEKEKGANPALTNDGKINIGLVFTKIVLSGIVSVIIGTGKRFLDTFEAIKGELQVSSVKYSPLLGSADSGAKTETGFDVVLADGTVVPIGSYIGLIGTPGINLWEWLDSLSDNTLLVTGREFIGALGVKNAKACATYQVDTDTKEVQQIG